MLVRDIDKALDMRLILRVRQNTELFNAISDLRTKLPVFIYGKGSEVWMSTYFPKDSKNQKIDILLKRFRATEYENAFVVDTRINNVKDLAIIDKLMKLPSFIINRSDISGGFVNIYARFHRSQLDAVSALLADYTADKENSRVDWLGPSPGITKVMDLINSEYPISLVTYRIPINGDSDQFGSIINSDFMLEMSNSLMTDGRFSTVLYSSKQIQDDVKGLTPVSPEDGVYMMSMSNSFLADVRNAANTQHIMRVRFFIKPDIESFEATVFLPTSSIYDYYSILFDVARRSGNKLSVKYLLPYTQNIWEFI